MEGSESPRARELRRGFPLLLLLLLPFTVSSAVHHVKQNGKGLDSIKEGIRKADPYDTVMVHSGTYHETDIWIEKPLTLLGKGRPVVDADSQEVQVFILRGDSITFGGFDIRNMGMSYMDDLAAVRAVKSEGGVIQNNRIEDAFFGIYLQGSKGYKVHNNRVTDDAKTQASSGNAIHLWKTDSSEICHNYVAGYRDGIYFEFVEESEIHHNYSENNLRYGLHFMFSNHDLYAQNTFRDNGAGVAVMFSKKIEMRGNHFFENQGGSSYGLLLKEINYSRISGNTFEKNTVGITAEGTNDVRIDSNSFLNNGKAIDMKGNCVGNKVVFNDFVANSFEVVTNSAQNRNRYERNFWSSYAGYDLDRDGIGDEPHRPLSLYAKVIDEIPAAAILMKSFFVRLLDLGERVMPTLVAEDLTDEEPRMKAYDYDRDNGAQQDLRETAGIE